MEKVAIISGSLEGYEVVREVMQRFNALGCNYIASCDAIRDDAVVDFKTSTRLLNGYSEHVLKLTNHYKGLNDVKSSKNRLAKCAKGFHEYVKAPFESEDVHGIIVTKWLCMHCKKEMSK
jgi:hypothetical protein